MKFRFQLYVQNCDNFVIELPLNPGHKISIKGRYFAKHAAMKASITTIVLRNADTHLFWNKKKFLSQHICEACGQTIPPPSKGHPRSIEQEIETAKTFQTHIQTIKLTNLSI